MKLHIKFEHNLNLETSVDEKRDLFPQTQQYRRLLIFTLTILE